MSGLSFKLVESKEQITSVVNMAHVIWNEHYPAIIGQEQVDYMIEKFQSFDAIYDQIKSETQFYQVQVEEVSIGYLSFELKNDCLFLSKVYLIAQFRGKGYGRILLEFVFDKAVQYKRSVVRLTVNKLNKGALNTYLKLGFIKTKDVVVDIGGGFVMDDYVLERKLN